MASSYAYYLRLDGITGDVKTRGYIGWIEVLSWADTGGRTTGGAAITDSEVRFALAMQSAVTRISAYCAQGQSIPSAELDAVKSGRSVLILKFENVEITSCALGGTAGAGSEPMVSFSISFESKTVSKILEPDAADGSVSPMGWALRTK